MRLRRIVPVRFGSLPPEVPLGDLGDGLNVVVGPNEAGKTSFTALVRHVLYGFPNGRSVERQYLPPNGDKRSGRLVFAEGEDEWVLERVDGARGGTVAVRGPEGDDLLRSLTDGVTPDVYRSVFGFGLDELADLATLSDIQQRLYATAAGLRVDPQAVRQQLKDRAEALWSQQGRKKVVHQLNAEIGDVRRRIREAERRAEDFRDEQAELDRLSARTAELEERAREARLAATRLGTRAATAHQLEQQLRDADEDREKLRRSLDDAHMEAERLDLDESLLANADEIDALVARSEWYQESTLRAETAAERAREAQRQLTDALASIGGGWDEERLERVPTDTTVESGIDSAEERLREAKRQLDEPERTAGEARIFTEKQREESRRLADTIGLDADQGQRQAEVRLGAVMELMRRSPSPVVKTSRSHIPSIVAVVVAVVMAAAGAVLGDWPLVAAALLPLALAAYLLLAPVNSEGVSADLLAAAGLEERPDAETLLDMQSRLQAFLNVSRNRVDAEGRLAVLEGKAADATRAYAAEEAQWEAWLADHGLADAGEPLAARAMLREVRRAQQARQRLTEAEADVREAREAYATYGMRVARLGLVTQAETDDPLLVASAVRRAREALASSRSADRKAEELVALGDRITAELSRLEERTAKASAEFASILKEAGCREGDIAELDGLAEIAVQDAERADQEYREALGRRSELAGKLEAVAADAEGSRLRLEEAGLVERLGHAVEDYAVTATALGLMEETLGKYQRERQPAIVKRAGEIFSAMTEGRYPQIVTALGSFELSVEDAEHRAKDGMSLSRGTAEQLYLALRLAYVENLKDVHPALPVMMDDVLVNFDDEGRQSAAAGAIAEFAKGRQVVFFTCHERVADLFAAAAPEHTRLALKRC